MMPVDTYNTRTAVLSRARSELTNNNSERLVPFSLATNENAQHSLMRCVVSPFIYT